MTDDVRDLSRQRFAVSAASYLTSPPHADRDELAHLVTLVSPQAHWLGLDVATGAGHSAAAFAPHVARVVATDITPKMLVTTRALLATRGLTNAELVLAEAGDLPFADGAFELVICRIAAHHFPDAAAFVGEAARVLRPAGALLVQDQGVPEDRATARAVDAFERLRDPSHNRILSEREWRGAFVQAGLEVGHVEWRFKPHDFAEWTATQPCSEETVAALVEMAAAAPAAVRQWFDFDDLSAPGARFVNRQVVVVGRLRA